MIYNDSIAKNIGPLSENPSCLKVPYHTMERLVEISRIASMLRNFPVTALHDDEIERFFELQNFFITLESRCYDEAGIE